MGLLAGSLHGGWFAGRLQVSLGGLRCTGIRLEEGLREAIPPLLEQLCCAPAADQVAVPSLILVTK